MQYSTRYIEPCHCIDIVFYGSISTEDIIDAVSVLPQYIKDGEHIAAILFDYSEVSAFNVTTNGIKQIADKKEELSKNIKDVSVAIVAPSLPIYGTFQIWLSYSINSKWKNSVFKTRGSAEYWIRDNVVGEHCKRQDCLIS